MAVPVNEILRVAVEGEVVGQGDIVNVYHFRTLDDGLDEADVVDDIIEILEELYGIINALLTVLYVINQVKVTRPFAGLDVGSGVFADTTPGNNANQHYALQCAYCVTSTTGILSVRGRKFFGPATEDKIGAGGTIAPADQAILASAGDFMIGTKFATNGDYLFGVPVGGANVFAPFTGATVNSVVATQRRRRIGVGS